MSQAPQKANIYGNLNDEKGTVHRLNAAPTVSRSIVDAYHPRAKESAIGKKLQGRIPLENQLIQSRHARLAHEKSLRRKQHKEQVAKGLIGRNETKRKGLWIPDPSAAQYSLFLPLHRLWAAYIAEILDLPPVPTSREALQQPPVVPSSSLLHSRLAKADYHGSIISVHDSKNKDLIGVGGIVVLETENTLRVVTQQNSFKVIPKRHSIFKVRVPIYAPAALETTDETTSGASGSASLPDAFHVRLPGEGNLPLPFLEFELYGNQFCYRAADRATKKFKHKETIELL